jgi:hypothetical protein
VGCGSIAELTQKRLIPIQRVLRHIGGVLHSNGGSQQTARALWKDIRAENGEFLPGFSPELGARG